MSRHAERAGSLNAEDRAFLEQQVAELGPRMLAYVQRAFVQQRTDAEDLVAEAFCRAAENIAALRASGRPEWYLLTVLRNLGRDRMRRRRVAQAAAMLVRTSGPAAGEDPREILDREDRLEALRAAVNELPQRFREVVVLRTTVGLKFEEIAELLRIPLGTALSRMHSALQQLRAALDKFDDR